MARKKATASQAERPGGGVSPRGSFARTKRGSKIGLGLIIWAALLGWIGVSSYNVIKQQYPSVYAQEKADGPTSGARDDERTAGASHEAVAAGHDPVAAGWGVNTSVGVLLTSGLVVFSVATGIRLLMNRRTENNT
jgi:hypothetical protein